jgi:hypothetical protein
LGKRKQIRKTKTNRENENETEMRKAIQGRKTSGYGGIERADGQKRAEEANWQWDIQAIGGMVGKLAAKRKVNY